MKGMLDAKYHEMRRTKRAYKYRLQRRGEEALKEIQEYCGLQFNVLLDVGTADGLMLDYLSRVLVVSKIVGLDSSLELLRINKNKGLDFVCGNAENLPFQANSVDIIISTATIEHIHRPLRMLEECKRVLKHNGLCIVTTPVPLFEKIATMIGHLKDEEHAKTLGLRELRVLFREAGFKMLKLKRFMISPIGFPFEPYIETLLAKIKLDFLFLNQLVVARKDT